MGDFWPSTPFSAHAPLRRPAFVLAFALALPVAAQGYVPAYERAPNFNNGPGTEVVLTYFGSTTCTACQDPAFKAALGRANTLLAERAASEGKTFVAIGVALDPSVEDGLAFLSTSGRFDEVAVGRNWFDSAALAHIWRSEGRSGRTVALPGVMVFEREMTIGEAGVVPGASRYLVERVGGADIPAWVAAGAPPD